VVRHPERADEVDVDDPGKGHRVLARGEHRPADSGVVDEHIDVSEFRHGSVSDYTAFVGNADVGALHDHAGATSFELVGEFGKPVEATSREHEVAANRCQRTCESGAETRARTGQHNYSIVEPEGIQWIHPTSSHAT
jgi:hypothetical protein